MSVLKKWKDVDGLILDDMIIYHLMREVVGLMTVMMLLALVAAAAVVVVVVAVIAVRVVMKVLNKENR